MINRYPDKKLSPIRVAIALAVVAAAIGYLIAIVTSWQVTRGHAVSSPWFAAYVDVTAQPTYAFEEIAETDPDSKEVVLSFIVASDQDPCTPAWGSFYTLDQAAAQLDLDRRIARLRQQGGNVAISFGGLLNDELAVACKDESKLKKAYEAVINRYDIDTIDLDLEQAGLTDSKAAARRANVIAQIQNDRRESGKPLAVWLTIPVSPQGLTEDGTNGVGWMLNGGVDVTGLNVMTMNYGQSRISGDSMFEASRDALKETHRQLGILYQQQSIYLSDRTLWSKIGATPMLGQNDVQGEIFDLDDAQELNTYGQEVGLGRMSMWSANRDIQCGSNYVDIRIVSDSCSGIEQKDGAFAMQLRIGFEGSLTENAGVVTEDDPNSQPEVIIDDPATSPYPIWDEDGAYLQGTKVVWRGNVYEAKWWTQASVPDNPVLQFWETPWRLIGPVLPGETPVKQATLPAGTYPEWSGTENYESGARVLFEGVPYQAKWWNNGDSPAASTSNPTGSPWVPLTQKQINEILN